MDQNNNNTQQGGNQSGNQSGSQGGQQSQGNQSSQTGQTGGYDRGGNLGDWNTNKTTRDDDRQVKRD